MKKGILFYLTCLLFTPFLLMQSACVTFAPVNSGFDSARMLKKGNVEIMGTYSHYRSVNESEGGTIGTNNNFGFRAGYGITNYLDLKFRYERIVPVGSFGGININYLDLAPKVRIISDNVAFSNPLGLYLLKDSEGISEKHFFITPQLLMSYAPNKFVEGSVTLKSHIVFNKEPEINNDVFYGFNVGLALSSDLEKWAIRPEFGWLTDSDADGLLNTMAFGVGLSYKFNPKPKALKLAE